MNIRCAVEQKWFYLTLGMVGLINLWLLLGRISFSGYIKVLVLLALLLFACCILYQQKILIASYILLLLFLTPQASLVTAPIRFGSFDIYIFDLLSGAVFVYLATQSLLVKKPVAKIHRRLIKMYLLLLAIGIIPILACIIRGQSNVLSPYRFFFYFIWVPVLVNLVREHRNPIKVVHYMIIINLISVVIALGKHFINIGIQLSYLDIAYGMNLFVLLILLPFCALQKPLIGNNKTTVIIFLICLIALLIDHSRKMYLGFSLGCILLCFTFKNLPLKRKFKVLSASLIILLSTLGLCYYSGLLEDIVSRSKTIFVVPTFDKVGVVDSSIGTRLYAWENATKIIIKHPLLGLGSAVRNKIANQLETGGDYYGFTYTGGSMHGFHLTVLAYYGIPVATLIYCVIITLLKSSWSKMKKTIIGSRQHHTIALGMFLSFICFMIASFFEGFEVQTMLWTWILLGLTVAFANLDRKAPLDKTANATVGILPYQHYRTEKTNYGKKPGY